MNWMKIKGYYRELQRTHPHRGPAAPGDRILPPVIASYEKEFPGVEVILCEGTMKELKESIQNFKADLLLCNSVDLPPYMNSLWYLKNIFLLLSQRPSH